MMDRRRGGRWVTTLLALGLLAGCSTTGDDVGMAGGDQPGAVAPVTDSAVSSSSLPPIGGADGSVEVASADPAAAAQSGLPPVQSDAPPTGNVPAAAPAAPGSFVSLSDVSKTPPGPGRDLAGGLSVEKLLGGWTVASGATTCRLNLTYSAAGAPDHYRASAPGCSIATLSSVSSWALVGTQLQLFDESNTLVGALLLSGNRFIGTLSGGQSISMAG
jgi:hypothetical protein